MFVVDKDTPGVRLVAEPHYTHVPRHAIVAFDDAVPTSQLMAPRAMAWRSPTRGSATSG
jgi:hypothetical protein